MNIRRRSRVMWVLRGKILGGKRSAKDTKDIAALDQTSPRRIFSANRSLILQHRAMLVSVGFFSG